MSISQQDHSLRKAPASSVEVTTDSLCPLFSFRLALRPDSPSLFLSPTRFTLSLPQQRHKVTLRSRINKDHNAVVSFSSHSNSTLLLPLLRDNHFFHLKDSFSQEHLMSSTWYLAGE